MKHLTFFETAAFLHTNPDAVFIDCRSEWEFLFVGHPKDSLLIPWYEGTDWDLNPRFLGEVRMAASMNRPVVLLANLSGFDGSPESMRSCQLEFGAEIGRAVVNFRGPIVFCVVSRFHGGAYVVFSRTLNENIEVTALEGTYASVIGGAPAAGVVFSGEVERRTSADPRLTALELRLAEADDLERARLRAELTDLRSAVRSEKLGEVAAEFDRIHSIQRAVEVGSVDEIISVPQLRPKIIEAVERGLPAGQREARGA